MLDSPAMKIICDLFKQMLNFSIHLKNDKQQDLSLTQVFWGPRHILALSAGSLLHLVWVHVWQTVQSIRKCLGNCHDRNNGTVNATHLQLQSRFWTLIATAVTM